MFIHLANGSINTDNENIGMAPDKLRYSLHSTYSTKDRIIAYLSIAFGVIGFAIFLYFYCAPLIKTRRKASAEKKRRNLVKPVSNQRQHCGLDDGSSFYSNDSSEFQPLVPSRIVPRDSVVPAKANHASMPVNDLDPPLPNLSSPTRLSLESRCATFQSSSDHPCNSLSDFCTSTPYKGSSSLLTDLVVGELSESLSTTVIESDHPDSIGSLQGPSSSLALANTAVPLAGTSRSRTGNICGTILPRTSSLNAILPSSGSSKSNVVQEGRKDGAPGAVESIEGDMLPCSPVYADSILPRYLRDSCRASAGSRLSTYTEAQQMADRDNAICRGTSIAIADSAKDNHLSRIQSLHVRETVLARASNYTRGLVGGSPIKAKQAGTELQFEMVKDNRF